MAHPVKRYIITGAPGTGKTSVLDALREKGYSCFNEVSRELIKEQQQSDGQLFPWMDLNSFAHECYKRMNRQNNNAMPGINFFDRAIPDNIAYLQSMNLNVDNCFYSQLERYEREVFYFPVWPEIFQNDTQRPETLERAQELDYHLKKTYNRLNFKLIKMNLTNVMQRVAFVEDLINK